MRPRGNAQLRRLASPGGEPSLLTPGPDPALLELLAEVRGLRRDMQRLMGAPATGGGVYPWAPDLDSAIEVISRMRPGPKIYDRLAFTGSTARTNEEHRIGGDWLAILPSASAVPFTIRLNERESSPIDSSQVRQIAAPFWRLYISNQAGPGDLELLVGRGASFSPREHGVEELAARLGSIVTIDRRGEVVEVDDFEAGILRWSIATLGSSAVTASTAIAAKGQASARLVTGTLANDNVFMNRRLPALYSTRFGVEFWFSLDADSPTQLHFTIGGLSHLTGNPTYARLRFQIGASHVTDQELLFFDHNQNFVSAGTINRQSHNRERFHQMKVVWDVSRNEYVRAVFNGVEFDLRGNALFVPTITAGDLFEAEAGLETLEDAAKTAFVDNFIFTRNEP